MPLTKNINNNCIPRQLKLPLDIEKIIDIADPVYTFCEVMDHIDLSKYFVEKGCKTEKLCRNDIRYIYLLNEMNPPSFATIGNFIREKLTDQIEKIFM